MNSNLKKATKAQKNAFLASFKTFNAAAVVILSAEREPALVPYFEKANAPETDASKQAQKDWAREIVLPLLPACLLPSVGGVTFTANKEKALIFDEATTPDAFRNCGELLQELGASLGEGKGRAVYFYREKQKRVPRVREDFGAAGKLYETDKSGARVFDIVTVREYICKRGEQYTPAEFIAALFAALGITQEIAEQAARALELKAAKAVHAAEIAAERAKATAERAKEQATKAKKRAAEKAEKAEQVRQDKGLTGAEVANILQEDATKQAEQAAEKAEGESIKAGENVRKKTNTKTKASEQITK